MLFKSACAAVLPPGGRAAVVKPAQSDTFRLGSAVFSINLSSHMFSARRLAAALRTTGVRLASGVPERDPRFAIVQDADIRFFESVLGEGGVVTDTHELAPFNKWAGWEAGQVFPVLRVHMHDGQ